MTTSTPPAARFTRRTGSIPRSRGVVAPPQRPDLPTWFGGATTTVYAVGAGLTCALALATLTLWAAPSTEGVVLGLAGLLAVIEMLLAVAVGAWCFTAAGTRRVDPTTEQLDRAWLLAAWFIPVAHVLVPHRMFGDLWASAKWQQSDRRGNNTPLAPRPWVMSAWACAWGAGFAWVCSAFVMDVGATFLEVHLVLSALSTALLCGVVRAIAKELQPVSR